MHAKFLVTIHNGFEVLQLVQTRQNIGELFVGHSTIVKQDPVDEIIEELGSQLQGMCLRF